MIDIVDSLNLPLKLSTIIYKYYSVLHKLNSRVNRNNYGILNFLRITQWIRSNYALTRFRKFKCVRDPGNLFSEIRGSEAASYSLKSGQLQSWWWIYKRKRIFVVVDARRVNRPRRKTRIYVHTLKIRCSIRAEVKRLQKY